MKILCNYNLQLLYCNKIIKKRSHDVIAINPLNGLDIGIPLNIFSNIYTNLHYGYDITTTKSILIQFLLGYYTYGKDRYLDAIEYTENPYNIKEEKYELYNFLYKNKNVYNLSLNLTFIWIVYLFFNEETTIDILYNIPFIPILYINGFYKYFKPNLYIFKSLYISIMWTISTIIIPCILYEHTYKILNYPNDYLPCLLTLFATSNFADSKDIIEDKINNITTIPVKYGFRNSNTISFIAIMISSILLIENNNFENRIFINSLVELQNIGLMYLLYNNTF